jgi:hypothetical protein
MWPVRRDMYSPEVECEVMARIRGAQDKDPAVGFCKLSNGSSSSTKDGEFLDQLPLSSREELSYMYLSFKLFEANFYHIMRDANRHKADYMTRGSVVVKALCCKPEGRGFKSR